MHAATAELELETHELSKLEEALAHLREDWSVLEQRKCALDEKMAELSFGRKKAEGKGEKKKKKKAKGKKVEEEKRADNVEV